MNKNFGKLENDKLEYAPDVLVLSDRVVANPSAATYISAGWFPIDESAPEDPPPVGSHYEADGWEISEQTIVKKWKTVQDSHSKTRRSLSKRKLYNIFNEMGKWEQVQQFMELNGVWMDFTLATTLDDDDPLVLAASQALQGILDISAEQMQSILDRAVAD